MGSQYHFSPLLFWESFRQIPCLSYLPNSGWGLQDPMSWGLEDGSRHLPNRAQVRVLGPRVVGTEKACGLDLDPPLTSMSAACLELSALLVVASHLRSPCARIRTGPPGMGVIPTVLTHSFIHPLTHSLINPFTDTYLNTYQVLITLQIVRALKEEDEDCSPTSSSHEIPLPVQLRLLRGQALTK